MGELNRNEKRERTCNRTRRNFKVWGGITTSKYLVDSRGGTLEVHLMGDWCASTCGHYGLTTAFRSPLMLEWYFSFKYQGG